MSADHLQEGVSDSLARRSHAAGILAKTVLDNDLSKLTPRERTEYYFAVCNSLHLNPLTRPFELIRLNGKLTLYARKDATDQLRALHRISLDAPVTQVIGDAFVVTVTAKAPDGRTDADMASVSIKNLQGDALCNAMMKCVTKAKRRVTLSICGLGGFLDETEARTVKNVEFVEEPADIDDGQVWRSWKSPSDAITWAVRILPEYTVAQLEQMFESLEAPTGKKAPAWCQKVLELVDHSF